MKKNLLQPETKKEILDRINKLHPQSNRQWGKMNVNQGLRHMYEGLIISYGDIKTASRGGWLKKKLMRYFILKSDMPTPKEKAETFPEINQVKRGVDPPDFEKEKKTLFEAVNNFPSKTLMAESSMLGKMSKYDWARLNYTHLDHHLKQFGA